MLVREVRTVEQLLVVELRAHAASSEVAAVQRRHARVGLCNQPTTTRQPSAVSDYPQPRIGTHPTYATYAMRFVFNHVGCVACKRRHMISVFACVLIQILEFRRHHASHTLRNWAKYILSFNK